MGEIDEKVSLIFLIFNVARRKASVLSPQKSPNQEQIWSSFFIDDER